VDLLNRLGALRLLARAPPVAPLVDEIQQHEAVARVQGLIAGQRLDAAEVHVHHLLGAGGLAVVEVLDLLGGGVQDAAHRGQQLAHALDVLGLGAAHLLQQLLDARVHHRLCQHTLPAGGARKVGGWGFSMGSRTTTQETAGG
jgi:hypothetical protein